MLKDEILKGVDINSGGIKMISLLTRLAYDYYQREGSAVSDDFPEQVENAVKEMPELEILEYVSVGPPPRLKQFVYRVLA